MRLRDKVAIVTGAAAGIGQGTALRFAREGASVAVTDLDEAAEKTADQIRAAGGEAMFMRHDVTREEDWVHVAQQVVRAYTKVDILFNNAGVAAIRSLVETTLEEWNRTMAVNTTGPFLGMKHIVPLMAKRGSGSVINVSSDAGLVGCANFVAYCASKGAVRLMTKSVAVEYAGKGVRVNSIHPAYVDTAMVAHACEVMGCQKEDLSRAPLGRIATVEEVASLVVFLASDESSYCTGAEFIIDGGVTAQ